MLSIKTPKSCSIPKGFRHLISDAYNLKKMKKSFMENSSFCTMLSFLHVSRANKIANNFIRQTHCEPDWKNFWKYIASTVDTRKGYLHDDLLILMIHLFQTMQKYFWHRIQLFLEVAVIYLIYFCVNFVPWWILPLDETHLVVVRGLIHQEVSTKVRQWGELNWASQLQPSGQQISSTVMSSPESILIRQDQKDLSS